LMMAETAERVYTLQSSAVFGLCDAEKSSIL